MCLILLYTVYNLYLYIYIVTFSINIISISIKSPSDLRKSNVLWSLPEERCTSRIFTSDCPLLAVYYITYVVYIITRHYSDRAVYFKRAEFLS